MILEIFSDLICPWCYIGKRRLDSVLATELGTDVQVVWRAFQLYPGIPTEGMSRKDFMVARYGAQGSPGTGREVLIAEAKGAGIRMDFNAISRMPNTFTGHRLLHVARSSGHQHALAERLFALYFEEGQDIGDLQVLTAAGVEVGMDAGSIASALTGTEGHEAVLAELDRAANIGISGVPCFIFAGSFALPGAQSPEVMGQFIERARSRLSQPSRS